MNCRQHTHTEVSDQPSNFYVFPLKQKKTHPKPNHNNKNEPTNKTCKTEEMGSANSHQPAGKDKRKEKSQQCKSAWGETAKWGCWLLIYILSLWLYKQVSSRGHVSKSSPIKALSFSLSSVFTVDQVFTLWLQCSCFFCKSISTVHVAQSIPIPAYTFLPFVFRHNSFCLAGFITLRHGYLWCFFMFWFLFFLKQAKCLWL